MRKKVKAMAAILAVLISFSFPCFGGNLTASASTIDLLAPTDLRMAPASNMGTSVVAVWEKPADHANVKGYKMYVNDVFAGSTNMTYFKVTGLLPSTAYSLSVKAYDANGDLSHCSKVLSITTTAAPTQIINVKDKPYSASGDGTTKDTKAIQAAIDACPKNGEVYLPSGTYLSGALFLHSNMIFYLASGAQLKPSTDLSDYPFVSSRHDIQDLVGVNPAFASLINAGTMDSKAGDTTNNIKIMGPGTIGDAGNGVALRKNYDDWTGAGSSSEPTDNIPVDKNGIPEYQAGQHIGGGSLINLKNCGNVYMDGIHIRNGMMWTINPVYSDHITALNLDINTTVHNGDGFDPNSATDVYILGTQFATGDDCSAIKSGKNADGLAIARPSQNIYYRGDVFNSGHGGVTIGSEMSGGIKNIFVEDCSLIPVDESKGTVNPGIRVKVSPSRGAYINNLQVRDSICNQISVITNYDGKDNGTPGVPLPDIENFQFTNITAPNYAKSSDNIITLTGTNLGDGGKNSGSHISYLKNIQFNRCKFYSATLNTCQNIAFNNCTLTNDIATSGCSNISVDGKVLKPSFPVNDTFDDSVSVPATWVDTPRSSGAGGGLFLVKGSSDNNKGGNQYLEIRDMGKGYETTDRSFAAQSSVTTAQFSFSLPSLTNASPYFKFMDSSKKSAAVYYQVTGTALNLAYINAKSKTVISNLTAKKWYTVKSVIDIPNKVMDIYVNGDQVLSKIPLSDTTTRNVGTFEVRPPNGNSTPVYVDIDDFAVSSATASSSGGPISGIAVSADSNAITSKGGSLQLSAKVTSSDDNDTAYVWGVVNPDLSATSAASIDSDGLLTAKKNGTVLVTATAKDGSGTMGVYSVAITGQQSCVSIVPVKIATTVGAMPKLPSTVYELNDDGSSLPATVKWDAVSSNEYGKVGTFTVNGTVEETSVKALATVTVSAKGIGSIKPLIVKTTPGSLNLPNTVTAVFNDGTTEELSVTWEKVDSAQYASINVKGFTVRGSVSGTTQKATAQISVLPVIVKGVTPLLVAADGTGDYRTVNEAIQSIPENNAVRQIVFVKPGAYREKLLIDRPYVTLAGENADSTVITNNDSPMVEDDSGKPYSTYNDYTMQVTGHDFSAQDITIENSAGSSSGQSVALDVYADHASFTNCRILGYQDTLLTRNKTDISQTDNVPEQPTTQTYRQYFKNCYIAGSVDYIFGASEAIFDKCTLYSRLNGYITAADTPQNQKYGYVFMNCNLASSNIYNGDLSVYLGRSWRPYSDVAYLNCKMGSQIALVGWKTMHSPDDVKTVRYSEYHSVSDTSPATSIDTSKRKMSTQLTDAQAKEYTVDNIFDQSSGINCKDSWNPAVLVVPTVPVTPVSPITPVSPVVPPVTPTKPVTPKAPPTFVSDTNSALSVNDAYTFKITSTNSKVPTFVVGTPGIFTVQFVKQSGSDYFYKITAIGPISAQTGIYVNGEKLLVATVKSAACAFVSDTNSNLSVNSAYTFKITSKNGKAPSFIVGTPGAFDVKLVKQAGSDYFIKITAVGAPGAQAGIYINGGSRFLVATVRSNPSYVKSDTTGFFKVKSGKSYVFKLTGNAKPSFVAGTGSAFKVSFVKKSGKDYFFRATAVGKAGQASGFYINHQARAAVATISQ